MWEAGMGSVCSNGDSAVQQRAQPKVGFGIAKLMRKWSGTRCVQNSRRQQRKTGTGARSTKIMFFNAATVRYRASMGFAGLYRFEEHESLLQMNYEWLKSRHVRRLANVRSKEKECVEEGYIKRTK